FQHPPTVRQIEAFLIYLARTRPGKLGSKPNTHTLNKLLDQIRRAVRATSDHCYSKNEVQSLRKFINNLPAKEGISTKSRTKTVAFFPVVEELIYFMWACDEYDWKHPRCMQQTSFILIMMGSYGLRPGEILESCIHRGSNQGLTYGDVEFSLTWHKGALRLLLLINLRLRKGRRGKESQA
ncbi:hypothetical protein AOQ84DRAFT_290901, partial [Glonium stellatum]